MKDRRYSASGLAGARDGNRYAVLDHEDARDGKGARRVSFHRTFQAAQAEARRLNAAKTCDHAVDNPACRHYS